MGMAPRVFEEIDHTIKWPADVAHWRKWFYRHDGGGPGVMEAGSLGAKKAWRRFLDVISNYHLNKNQICM